MPVKTEKILSKAELKVLELVGKGFTSEAIGIMLTISTSRLGC